MIFYEAKHIFRLWNVAQSISCNDGYFNNNGVCSLCHPSCLTCSNSTSCLTCYDMILNPTTKLCERCPDGQYFNIPKQLCEDCGNSCIDKCAYQSHCFECGDSQRFDLTKLTCVDLCDSENQITFQDVQFHNISVCRDNMYYVNPESIEIIELGLVFAELFIIRSHSNATINIFIKEGTSCDIQQGYNYILNITSVTIQPYSDSSISAGMATLYVRQYSLNMFNNKTSFNLVSDNTLTNTCKIIDRISSKLNSAEISSHEISQFSSDTVLYVWRSSVALFNLRLQGDVVNNNLK